MGGAAGAPRARRGRGGVAGVGARLGAVRGQGWGGVAWRVGRGRGQVDKTEKGGFVGVGVPRHDPRRGTPNQPAVMAGSTSPSRASQAPCGGPTPPPCMAGCSVFAPPCMVAGPNGLVLV